MSPPASHEPAKNQDLRFVAALAAVVLLATGGFVWLTSSRPAPGVSLSGQAAFFETSERSVGPTTGVAASRTAFLIVDVEGAVVSPGLQRLPPGSRVGDAIAAAGGYSAQIDIRAAASVLNLAEPLSDGDKVHVPALGQSDGVGAQPVGSAEGPPGQPQPDGLVDINMATAEQLDTLPGIGPVTAAKIIGAREQALFASIDELVSRDVVGTSTFEKIRALITIGP